ncbi:MAG TPA: autotransporter-associated beta strand repeat-containing protein, partial [Candidatus Polarisedimenticolia bacterium]|nr:autotransporter-associated beta strand repeat-containing protein [Candidatus Polarisedimenticolia bacterium]
GFNPNVTGSHFTMALDTNSVPGVVYLSVTGGQGSSLVWSSTGDTNWDSVTTNWTDLSSHNPSLFFSGDTVVLDDTAAAATLGIPANVAVYPTTISNISDGVNFTINGPGKISGSANIVKTGMSTLTIATPNDFTGTVDIQNGVLSVANHTALGSTSVGTTVEAGGTLDIGGQALGPETVTIAGDGFNGQGAVVNSGGTQGTAFNSLVLSSNAAVGGTGNWSINNAGGTGSLSTGGQPWKFTKVGPNVFGLQNLSTVDAALGDIEVAQGTLEFNGGTAGMGDPNYTNYVDAGATLQFVSSSQVWNKFFDLTGDGSANTINNGTASITELAGQVTLHDSVVMNVGGSSLTISGLITGDGSLTKTGSSPLILSNVETYTGDTTINAGAMRLAGNATILNTTNITIAQGATLTVTGRVDATFTLVSGQNLSGNGVVAGSLVTLDGSTVSPGGLGTVGALTVSNSITLGGTNVMELNQDSATNDMLKCNGAITYGGVLNLPNLGSDLTNGATFQLFKAGSYSGSFASITPATPGTGLSWNTSALSSGIISITNNGTVVGPTTNATIYSVTMSGGNIILHGTNHNSPGNSFRYVVLSSTNVALPLTNWTPVVTNSFINSNGSFDYTNPIVPAAPRQFFDVKVIP